MPKIVAIGDSITQGFQSGAISKTDWSYPAIIARSLQMNLPQDFRIPTFPQTGLPLNIEELVRVMESQLGIDVSRAEWTFQFPKIFSTFLSDVENYYERGPGSQPGKFLGDFHNLAVWGFRVADALDVTPAICKAAIERDEGWLDDDFLGTPSGAMYRTAFKVLEPSLKLNRSAERNQVGVLRSLAQSEGVDVVLLGLGANDCLGTVFDLEIRDMTGHESAALGADPEGRRKWNLTSAAVFESDYRRLVAAITQSLQGTQAKVYAATVPKVTIPPVTTGIGELKDKYFEFYARFFVNEKNFNQHLHRHLTGQAAAAIDARIDQFNQIIRTVVPPGWRVVDVSEMLDRLAVKRNNFNDPGRALREYYAAQGVTDHPLLRLDPIPSALLYRTDRSGRRVGGGLFSLDGVHPTTIGYGIIAEEFLRVMSIDSVGDPRKIPWAQLLAHDTLIQAPPAVWGDIVTTAEDNSMLWEAVFRIMA